MSNFDDDPFADEYEEKGRGVSLDFLMQRKGLIGIILVGIAAILSFFSFAKGTKSKAKKQIQNAKAYKAQNKEKVEEIKDIDRETKELVKDLIELEEKSKIKENEVPVIIDNVIKNIDETKTPENKSRRTVKGTNDRLKNMLNKNK